jgi:microcompartment protein CcmL/EutN
LGVSALGMIETIGLVSAIEAADTGLKAADVRLLGTDYVRGGLVMVRFEGEVAAVNAAVEAGKAAASHVGKVFSAHVIARAMPEVFCMLAADEGKGPARRAQNGCAQCGSCEGGRRDAGLSNRAGGGAGNRPEASEHGNDPEERSGTPEHGGNQANHRDARSSGAPLSSSDHEPSPPDAPHSAENGRRALLPAQEELEGWKVLALRSFTRTLPGFRLSPAEIRYATKRALMDALAAYRAGEV